MSFSESSAASRRIFAQISLAFSSRTSEPSQMMRSFSSLSKTLVATRGSAIFKLLFPCSVIRIYRRTRSTQVVFAVGISGVAFRDLARVRRDGAVVARQVRHQSQQRD